jgi:hypothetical protein
VRLEGLGKLKNKFSDLIFSIVSVSIHIHLMKLYCYLSKPGVILAGLQISLFDLQYQGLFPRYLNDLKKVNYWFLYYCCIIYSFFCNPMNLQSAVAHSAICVKKNLCSGT